MTSVNWIIFAFALAAILGAVICYCSYIFTKGAKRGNRQD